MTMKDLMQSKYEFLIRTTDGKETKLFLEEKPNIQTMGGMVIFVFPEKKMELAINQTFIISYSLKEPSNENANPNSAE